jgi:hypothetical protein
LHPVHNHSAIGAQLYRTNDRIIACCSLTERWLG